MSSFEASQSQSPLHRPDMLDSMSVYQRRVSVSGGLSVIDATDIVS
jgi:hypothetical protein